MNERFLPDFVSCSCRRGTFDGTNQNLPLLRYLRRLEEYFEQPNHREEPVCIEREPKL